MAIAPNPPKYCANPDCRAPLGDCIYGRGFCSEACAKQDDMLEIPRFLQSCHTGPLIPETPAMKDQPKVNFVEILARLITARNTHDLRDAVPGYYIDGLNWALQQDDMMDALIEFARNQDIGWQINAGWRCDVDFEQASCLVGDNKLRGQSESYDIHAVTPQGALAAGILVVLHDRDIRADAEELPTHRHYKGGLYRVIGRGRHTERDEDVVLYKHIAPHEPGFWVRPAGMFDERIPSGELRFTPLTPDEARQALQSVRRSTHGK